MNALPACWTQAYPDTLSAELINRLATYHALRGGRRGQEIAELIRDDKLLEVVRYPIHEYIKEEGWDLLQLIHCRQALGFYQKNSALKLPGVDPEQAALETWLGAEARCKSTNEFFLSLSGMCQFSDSSTYDRYLKGLVAQQPRVNPTPHFVHLLEGVRALIKSVLGKAPKVCDIKMRFGPGATRTIKRNMATPQNKLAETPTCSYNLYASGLLPQIFEALPHWSYEHISSSTTSIDIDEIDGEEYFSVEVESFVDVRLVSGRIQFVLKNALTKRSMESQPTLDSAFQLGIGDEMTVRLGRAGIDITDQDPNRSWARVGSLTDSVVTLDLSSASDLIAYQLVKALLPTDWFTLLNAGRTGSTEVKIDGKTKTIILEKFSAMGNGFTFPLETLIFWAVAIYSSRSSERCGSVSVFGDDIIVHRDAADETVRNLELLGFLVNTKKSYFSGPFRESCGRDYYRGTSVRPYYQKRVVTAMELFQLHNFYVRNNELGEPDGTLSGIVLDYIHPDLRKFGPDGYGDGHLLSHRWEAKKTRAMRRSGYGGVLFTTFKVSGVGHVSIYPGDYVTPLYNVYVAESGEPPHQSYKDRVWFDPADGSYNEFDCGWAYQVHGKPPISYKVGGNVSISLFPNETEFTNSGRPIWEGAGPTDPVDAPYEEVEVYTFAHNAPSYSWLL